MAVPSKYDGLTTPPEWQCVHCGHSRAEHFCPSGFTREKHDFVAMLRIKNEARWIAEVIDSIAPLCARIFILDDHSSDDTIAICRSHSKVTLFESPFTGFNEARDKNWLLDRILVACEPQWILCVDGDEVLAPGCADVVRQHALADPVASAYSLKIVFLWNDRRTQRIDRVYGEFWRPSLFRPFHPRPDVPDDLKIARETRFMSTPFGRRRGDDEPNLHCSSVPQRFLAGCRRLPARLLHLGYLHREDRVRKLDLYNSIDWLNAAEDCYRHMTQGDSPTLDELPRVQQLLAEGILNPAQVAFLTNTPVEATLVHAGPLRLAPIEY